MLAQKKELILSVGVFSVALILLLVVIPQAVVSPGRVANEFLMPSFWPRTIAWLMCLIGGLMILKQLLNKEEGDARVKEEEAELVKQPVSVTLIRFLMFVGLLFLFYFLIPIVGLPVASVAVFFIFSLLLCRTEYRMASICTGVILPLVLYAFFYHVAGVDIPQGEYWRLP